MSADGRVANKLTEQEETPESDAEDFTIAVGAAGDDSEEEAEAIETDEEAAPKKRKVGD
jgi:hypothetical protein